MASMTASKSVIPPIGATWEQASAKARMHGNSQSGVTEVVGAGVAPQPGRSWRRLIQTVVSPAALAGTWSWNKLCATCSSLRCRCRVRRRGRAIPGSFAPTVCNNSRHPVR